MLGKNCPFLVELLDVGVKPKKRFSCDRCSGIIMFQDQFSYLHTDYVDPRCKII